MTLGSRNPGYSPGGGGGGGSGDVSGPASSTDNAIARFDGAGGKTIQTAAPLVADDGRITDVTDPTSDQDAATRAYVLANAGGDVSGPASSTDNALARYDGTTGKLLQGSAPLVEDDGRISSVTDPTNPQDAATRSYVLANAGGPGDVVGPGSSTDDAIARYDGTTGKLLQGSAPLIADDGRITTVTDPTNPQDAATRAYVLANAGGKNWGPVDFDNRVWGHPPIFTNGTNTSNAGGLLLMRFRVPYACTVSGAVCVVGTAGSGTTTGFLALLNSSLAFLGQTANTPSLFTSVGFRSASFTGGNVSLSAGQEVYGLILFNGGTTPGMRINDLTADTSETWLDNRQSYTSLPADPTKSVGISRRHCFGLIEV